MNAIFHPDGRVTLPDNGDPAYNRVIGFERYWLSADLGQANDYSAVTLIRHRQVPEWCDAGQRLGKEERVIVYADRFRGQNYVDVVHHLVALMNRDAISGRVHLSIDGTSIGRVVSDLLRENVIPHNACTMTVGQNWSRKGD